MYQTLLFKESPLLAGILAASALISVKTKRHVEAIVFVFMFFILIIFYRYKPHNRRYHDNIIIAPAEGKITDIEQRGEFIYISTYLDFTNNHTQVYPANGTVIDRVYDATGKYNLANTHKGHSNEKKIHIIKMNNGNTIYLTQIAGFFPRRIVSSDIVPEKVMAGQYLGMIKFGSRVDILFKGDINKLRVKLNQHVNIGDLIYLV